MIGLLHKLLYLVRTMYYRRVFASYGNNSGIIAPLKINGGKNIFIGDKVFVQYKTWLAAVPLTGELECKLVLEDGVNIGHFNHIYATKSIILHKNVLTADKVYIADNGHGYEDVHTPIKNQPIIQKECVEIGEDSWLGENVCVIGASIGKHCIIGANSVVTHDIPDYSIAVGAPARVIKVYDPNSRKWNNCK